MPARHHLTTASLAVSLLLATAGQNAWSLDAAPSAAKCDRAQFRVVVDVGHTAQAIGARSARNVAEYDFNFELAWQIQHSLIEDGFTKAVLLVADGDARPSLFKRVAVANRLPADLFLSIHHDSVPDKFLEKWEFEERPSHFSDKFPGHSLFVSNQNPDFKASVQFGHLLGNQLKERGLAYAHHYTEAFMGHRQRILVDAEAGVYRYDQLIVLRATQMPAVLLEAGSIINRDEEIAVSSPERRDAIKAAVTAAVEMFCDLHAPVVARKATPTYTVAGKPQLTSGKPQVPPGKLLR